MGRGMKHTVGALAAAFVGALTLAGAAFAEEAAAPAAKPEAAQAAPTAAPDAPATPAAQSKKEFSDDAFLDAAYENCATVENRSASSCGCERKLIGDRVNADDKRMAFLYWTDTDTFRTEFEKRRKDDPAWQQGFGERFSSLQALVYAACGA